MVTSTKQGFHPFFWIYAISVIYLMLCSMHIHFSWGYDWQTMYIINWIVGILGFVYLLVSKAKVKFGKKAWTVFILFHLSVIWNAAGVSQILNIPIALMSLFFLSNRDKEKMLDIWTITYASILLISLVAWSLTWTDGLSSSGILTFSTGEFYRFENYSWLCVKGPYVFRFHSVFLEPGHTAMIGAFTVFANKYNLSKPQVLIVFVCSLVTLSLAGYVLLFLGFVIYKLLVQPFAKIMFGLIPFVVLVLIFYYGSKSYAGGDNFVNNYILERLEYDEEKGITGNNRYLGDTDATFSKYVSSGEIITGLDFSKYAKSLKDGSISGAGIKLYLLQKGIIGTLLIFLFYFSVSMYSKNRKFMFAMLAVYILAFLQRAYPLWESWVFIFILSSVTPLSILDYQKLAYQRTSKMNL